MSAMNTINATVFKEMVSSGANWLEQNKDEVDRLNVFPVPDGDTGTNMAMTMRSAAKFVLERSQSDHIGELAAQMAYGALMGARGNSGVILSQILSGFSTVVRDKASISAADIVQGFSAGADAAYNAVSNPMEGTILTVVREASEALSRSFRDDMDIIAVFECYLKEGAASLARTPELLPVLKQAGVVDAGAQGFLRVVEGMFSGIKGEPVIMQEAVLAETESLNDHFDHFFTDPESIQYPYCTEFLIQVNTREVDLQETIDLIKKKLTHYGDCMLVVGTIGTIKVHIHTGDLGSVLGFVSRFGELDDIKINNMRQQNRELQAQNTVEKTDVAIITVTNGRGLEKIFKSMGATHIIFGGQTMNPSTQDFLQVIEEVHADTVFILPNNKNIVMTAEQAAAIANESNVHVVPSKTIPQGLSALMAFAPDADVEENVEAMMEGLELVASGEVTTAVRNTEIENISIQEGQLMAILDGHIIAAENELFDALNKLVSQMATDGASLVTLYYGADMTEGEVALAVEQLTSMYADIDFEFYEGGQQIYPYIVSAEWSEVE